MVTGREANTPRQAGPRWYKRRNCDRVRFPGAEYYAPRDLLEPDDSGAWRWHQAVQADYVRRYAAKKPAAHPDDPTISFLTMQYLQELKDRVKKGTYGANTYETKLSTFDCIFKYSDFKNLPVSELTATMVAGFMETLAEKNFKPAYQAMLLATLQAMLNWAAKPAPRRNPERLIKENPARGVSVPVRPRVNRLNFPTNCGRWGKMV